MQVRSLKLGFGIVALLGAPGMMAQTTTVPPAGTLVMAPPAPGIIMGLAGGMSLGVPAVKGQPFSLVETTTSVRVLGDGTTITNKHEERKMRDAEGRTRTEISREHDGASRLEMVILMDPVAHTSTTLMVQSKTANVRHFPEPKPLTPEQEAKRAEMIAKAKAASAARQAAGAAEPSSHMQRNVEQLGSQTIAGLYAQGRRITLVIPAGSEGNDREMRVVTEEWMSPDLGMELERTMDDPRLGKSTLVVTELDRGDPSPELFQVPADYKVNETERD